MKRLTALSLLLVMLCSAFMVGTAAPAAEPEITDPKQLGEVLELREKNSETYRLEDGSYECVVFAEDKYFEDETGKLVEISNTVVPEKHTIAGKEYGFTNEANSNRIYFSENEPSVLVSTGKQDLAFNIVTDRAVTPVIGGLKDVGEIAEYSLSGDTCFAYMNAFEHTDLVYKVRNSMLKEYIVLNDASAPREFTFTFDTEGYTVSHTEYDTVGFYDGDGELVFELGDLFAVDSADAYTDELTYTIGETVDGKTDITVTLSDDYLNDSERVYPILVDPSVKISGTYETQDSFVSSLYPTTNYYTKKYIRMGWDSNYNIRRTYIRFNLPTSVPSNGISSSYMKLKKHDCGYDPELKAYRVTGSWTSNAITWNNKPSYTTTNASATAVELSNDWYRFYVTDIVKKWYDGTYQNYGFMVRNATESGTGYWSTFYSSDADDSYKPELWIVYSEPTYTVSYYGNGSTGGSAPTSQSSVAGASVVIKANSGNLVKKDCDFMGWNTSPSGNGTTYSVGQTITMPNHNLNLYAKWRTETYEIGIEAISDYSSIGMPTLNTSISCVTGLSTALLNSSAWSSIYTKTNNNVWEIDFKDVSLGGNDLNYADNADLVAYCGHGYASSGFLLANDEHNDGNVSRSDLRLGDVDLEWLLAFTCNFLNCNLADIGNAMQGAHMICGYKTDMTVTANGGSVFASYATGGISVREAWKKYGKATQSIISGNRTAVCFHSSCENDYLWGFGDTVEDPPGYNSQTAGDYMMRDYNVL